VDSLLRKKSWLADSQYSGVPECICLQVYPKVQERKDLCGPGSVGDIP
jgi:hypothetical protein